LFNIYLYYAFLVYCGPPRDFGNGKLQYIKLKREERERIRKWEEIQQNLHLKEAEEV
jgi:hypothetical protein